MDKLKKAFDEFLGKTLNYENLFSYFTVILKIIIILIFTKIFIRIFSSIIEGFFSKQKNSKFGIKSRKADTLSELLKSVLKYVMYFISVMWIFEILKFDIKTVIAVTSVLGVAIGFGAQNLIKDVITGFFILFEDQFAVGDYVSIDGMSGIVEVLGLRITKLRDFSGDIHVIPNGSIVKVTNKSRGNMRALVEIDIGYEEDIEKVLNVINKTAGKIAAERDDIVEGPEVLGITKFGESGATIRIIAKTIPMKQWDIEMLLRQRIKEALEKEGIRMQYPTRVILDKRRGS